MKNNSGYCFFGQILDGFFFFPSVFSSKLLIASNLTEAVASLQGYQYGE